jgi:type IV fimbrial biogenesis protein FimT
MDYLVCKSDTQRWGMLRCRIRRVAGFTLIELMVTVAVLAVLISLAAPSFSNAELTSKLAGNANRLSASATVARSEAIKRNAVVVVCMSANGTACTTSGSWAQGWIVAVQGSSPFLVLQQEQAAPSGFKISVDPSSTTSLSFQPAGVGTTVATFTVCRATPTVGSQERKVSLSATGRSSVTKTQAGVCP